jgi:predicted HicB family RNase H-like nuclease
MHTIIRNGQSSEASRKRKVRKVMTQKEIKEQAARYLKFVEWSEEDQIFVGQCPQLFEGGVHGKDEAAVYKELCEQVENWIELLAKDGIELPPPLDPKRFNGKLLLRLEPALHRRLAAKAQAAGESLNNYIARSLAKAA